MAIDLRKLQKPLAAFVRKSLNAWAKENPKTQICAVGLNGDGFHGNAELSVDTPEHSAEFVKDPMSKGWCGKDKMGRYCANIPDFEIWIAEFEFPGYPDLYDTDSDSPVEFIGLDGSKQRAEADQGGFGKHRIVFPLLKAVLTEFEPFDQLCRVAPFRAGVQMMDDDELLDFWLIKI